MAGEEKALHEFLSSLRDEVGVLSARIDELEEKIEEHTKKAEEQAPEEEQKRTAEEKPKPAEEQMPPEKPYGPPYPYMPPSVDFIRQVLALVRKMKPKDLEDFISKLEAMVGEGERGGEIGEPRRAEEQYEAPVIAKVLKYLKGRLSPREFNHVLRLLGVERETAEEMIEESIPEVVPEEPRWILPTGEKLSKSEFEEAVKETAEMILTYGREHQQKRE